MTREEITRQFEAGAARRLSHDMTMVLTVSGVYAEFLQTVERATAEAREATERAALLADKLAGKWRGSLEANRHHWDTKSIETVQEAINGLQAVAAAIRAEPQPT